MDEEKALQRFALIVGEIIKKQTRHGYSKKAAFDLIAQQERLLRAMLEGEEEKRVETDKA